MLASDINRVEGESCSLDGGDCDVCGCHFITGLLQAHYCPNCGSDKWDSGPVDPQAKAKARLEDLHPWIMEKVKGKKTYHYWMASWREGSKVHHVHLGSCKKMSQTEALQKAREMKAAALGIAP